MKRIIFSLVAVLIAVNSYAGPREDSLRYTSICIQAHADRFDYVPSTAQKSAMRAAGEDPKKVLSMLIGYVKESQKSFQEGIRLGTSNPKLNGMDVSLKREVIKSFKTDGAKCTALLAELKSIENPGCFLPGAHNIKGKENICPHDVNGKLEVAKFKRLK